MIWFDAVLEKSVDAESLRRGLSTLLDVDRGSVAVAYDITELKSKDSVTCLIHSSSRDPFSQLISIYLSTPLTGLEILGAASRLATLLQTPMLVANDESATRSRSGSSRAQAKWLRFRWTSTSWTRTTAM